LFQHLVCFFLLSADTPFIPVHRTGFSGAILINLRDIAENFNFDRNLSDWGKNQQLLQILVPKGMLEIATGFALAMTKRN
jgi:hypothetical protein